MIGAVTNHLWQSTLFALAAGVLAFALRQNGAHIRHRVWLIASLKFLVPFSALMSLGSALPSLLTSTSSVAPDALEAPPLSVAVDLLARPFTDDVFFPAAASTNATPSTNWIAIAIVGVWACGFLAVAVMRLRGWRRIRAALRTSTPLPLVTAGLQRRGADVPVRSAPGFLEPGVVGLWHPVLLMPAGIEQQLTSTHLEAVLAHELCHVQRRDNLMSAIHMVVEALFWFHPLVWLVGAKLIDERERACDEHVLRVYGEPRVYAESILNVCKLYVESPIACVSGVGGADLRRRVAAILVNRVGLQLNLTRKVTLAIAAMLAIALPLAAGMVTASAAAVRGAWSGQSAGARPSITEGQKFDVASVKPCESGAPPPGRTGGSSQASPGYLYLQCYTLRQLVNLAYDATSLLNKPYGPGGAPGVPDLVRGGPSWVTTDRFSVEAKTDRLADPESLTTSSTGQWAIKDPAMASMMRSLLEDRFQLKARRATEEQTMWALTVAKGGAKITPLAADGCYEWVFGKPTPPHAPGVPRCGGFGEQALGSYVATGIKIASEAPVGERRFQDHLFFWLYRMVIDRTGLKGRYSFTLDFTPNDDTPGVWPSAEELARRPGSLRGVMPDTFKNSATLFKALEDQLGLKLERVKAPAEYIVIERAERPRPNDPATDAGSPGRAQGAGMLR